MLPPIGDLHDGNGVPFVGALPLFFEVVATAEPNPHPTTGSPAQALPGVLQLQPDWPAGLLPTMPMPPGAIKPVMPLSTHYPPPYDPATQSAPSPQQEMPLSDIRAVLVEVY